MTDSSYPIEGSWRQAINGVRRARPSAMLSGAIAPTAMWLIAGLFSGFSKPAFPRSAIPLPLLVVLAIVFLLLVRGLWGTNKKRSLRLVRIITLVAMMYVILFLVTISGYFMLISIGMVMTASGLPEPTPTVIVLMYAAAVIVALLWGPRSLPRSKADDAAAFARGARWLPWLVGIQGFLVGLGVLLGTIASFGQGGWGAVALAGLGTLGGMLCVTFGILMLYRFVFLATHPVPIEVTAEFGLEV